jgi:hypothetical protein
VHSSPVDANQPKLARDEPGYDDEPHDTGHLPPVIVVI